MKAETLTQTGAKKEKEAKERRGCEEEGREKEEEEVPEAVAIDEGRPRGLPDKNEGLPPRGPKKEEVKVFGGPFVFVHPSEMTILAESDDVVVLEREAGEESSAAFGGEGLKPRGEEAEMVGRKGEEDGLTESGFQKPEGADLCIGEAEEDACGLGLGHLRRELKEIGGKRFGFAELVKFEGEDTGEFVACQTRPCEGEVEIRPILEEG